ncbi:hypothetical protein CEXT_156301 [Caerostris extrusa]|uniref:Uncharacterized protein n=1 Tax=Caerostris extrusa TaxID=172846 RepID=A0AAV4QLV7_CAEEX|nr:hypothetical protein CEXT_156301 [Caerostris extrusa]
MALQEMFCTPSNTPRDTVSSRPSITLRFQDQKVGTCYQIPGTAQTICYRLWLEHKGRNSRRDIFKRTEILPNDSNSLKGSEVM